MHNHSTKNGRRYGVDRRSFLRYAAMVSAIPYAPLHVAVPAGPSPEFSAYPFSLGVASGDPEPTGVVIWTRLAPQPLDGGGMSPMPVVVKWEVAHDERFGQVVCQGDALATPQLGHSVHVEVEGLQPNQWYFYRFHVGNESSPVGRTRTTPTIGSAIDRMRFAFTSCLSLIHI